MNSATALFDRVKTVSHAYTPEIEILSPTTARGIWACDFLQYWPAGSGNVEGGEIVTPGHWNHTDGYYHDTYVKIGEGWLFNQRSLYLFERQRVRLPNERLVP
jgi:hypothetical protein